MQPQPIKTREKLDRRLRVTSSMRNPQAVAAALYVIWRGANRPSEIAYADAASDNQDALVIDDALYAQVVETWTSSGATIPDDFKVHLNQTGLFTSQMEPLQVLLQLYWKLAKITFVDGRPDGAERTGGKRFLKQLQFTINLDLLDKFISSHPNQQEVFSSLFEWIKGNDSDTESARTIKFLLNYLSEDTWFKDGETTFLQEGIYEKLLESTTGEFISFSNVEAKGPLRILKAVINGNLHPVLIKSTAGIALRDQNSAGYIKRVGNYLDITAVNSEGANLADRSGEQDAAQEQTNDNIVRNLILYGAPGTGKSFELNQRKDALTPTKCERVTFYSDYSYSQFVGGYRPVPVYIADGSSIRNRDNVDLTRPGSPTIEYRLVAGPMLKMYLEAKKNPTQTYLLIIEELNRADAAGVFGDFFQLLDRDTDGNSVYTTQASDDIHDYLKENDLDDKNLSLPSNLYIWATLNNADQGVFPIDTAFKRRWNFEYLPLNKNEEIVNEKTISLNVSGAANDINWNTLRKNINSQLRQMGIQEDLMIGPFFLSGAEMSSDIAFKYKLLSYLRDDILRHQHGEFFSINGTLSDLIRAYESGTNIFSFNISE